MLAATLLALLVAWTLNSKPRALLDPRWKLPADLVSRQEQLVELRLPPSVDRVDWLAPNLRMLSLAQTAVSSLRGLPPRLRELDISNSEVASLKGIPDTVVNLDLSWTPIEALEGLPLSLRSLSLAGRRIESLEGLPGSLRVLRLTQIRVSELRGLPALEVLTLTGANFESLEGLPTSLRSLALEGTMIRSLDELPEQLESLSLSNNYQLSAARRLPDSVSHLETDRFPLPPLGNLLNLKFLSLWRQGQTVALPTTLSELVLDLTADEAADDRGGLPELRDLPLSLRRLSLVNASADRIPERLPASLSTLNLPWFRGRRLPPLPALRKLSLRWSNVDTLAGLPSSLQELDLSASAVGTLRGLPANLRQLRFQWFPLEGAETIAVLEHLEDLDLSGSETLRRLGPLPRTLRQLNVSQTELQDLGRDPLPAGLEVLDISNTKISSLAALSSLDHLRSLTLHAGQVKSLDGMPTSVRSLSFVTRNR
ncbi:MAG TPA: hypothetical protein VLX28_26785 [Thermoanaerobaculia bacterium]|nr:hypothetical protein [Thermoanaerobaculia bacterium]